MAKIKILMIDDSNIIHVIMEKIIQDYDDIEIVGEAYDGLEGIELVHKLAPDVVIMDLKMPKMDGILAINVIMTARPVPIIVFSSASNDIVGMSFRAIEYGAVDIVEKPDSEDFDDLKVKIRDSLIPKIRTFAGFKVMHRPKKKSLNDLSLSLEKLKSHNVNLQNLHGKIDESLLATPAEEKQLSEPARPMDKSFELFAGPNLNGLFVAIASSTGGPQTLQKLFSEMRVEKNPVTYVVVQHMAEGFIEGMVQWLKQYTALDVRLAEKGVVPQLNTIYVAPHGHHLIMNDNKCFDFDSSPAIHGIRPSASIFFESIGRVLGGRVLALVLTGMGNDGTSGLPSIKEHKGFVVAQDEESSLLYGMPKAALESGFVDRVLNLKDMPEFIAGFKIARSSF
ncbi:MAG: chemotaxis-specific protein-glutamate methyltransferase CheB [Spirochaetales bacterium]|nr:chemotaxis-specific protein-glutamate methyltransferase CheB [Spirochaetales bacterium]